MTHGRIQVRDDHNLMCFFQTTHPPSHPVEPPSLLKNWPDCGSADGALAKARHCGCWIVTLCLSCDTSNRSPGYERKKDFFTGVLIHSSFILNNFDIFMSTRKMVNIALVQSFLAGC